MLRVTADPNILVSGINFLGGKPFQILELARTGKISPTVSDAILDEMEDMLQRKFSFSPDCFRARLNSGEGTKFGRSMNPLN